MSTFHYIAHEEKTSQGTLTLAQMASLQVAPHQVKVAVKAFGVNRADLLQKAGKYPAPQGESPILGLEVAGEIVEVGSEVTDWSVGDRVCGLVAGGGYAQEAVIHHQHLIALPQYLSWVEGAGLAEVFLTAYQAVRTIGDVNQESRVLIHAGASAVGLAAIQIAKLVGAEVATTASSENKLAVCEKMGADIRINYQTQDYVQIIKDCWPKGATMVLDMVAGDYVNRNLRCLAMDGKIVYLAMLAGRYADKLDMALLLGKRASIMGSTLRNRSDDYKAQLVKAFTNECFNGFKSGSLQVNIDTVYHVDHIDLAHQQMADNNTTGKLVVCWNAEDMA